MSDSQIADEPKRAGSRDACVVRGYVGRFAPSPTGDMHFGMARSFLAAWLDARAQAGRVLLRFEDIDFPRNVHGADDGIMRDLEWLGLGWDGDVTWQSRHLDRFDDALATLRSLGRTFECTCSRRDILLGSSAPHGPDDEAPRYPGTCRLGARARSGRSPAVRLLTLPEDLVVHEDRLLGDASQNVHDQVGDFVLRRADGLWAYQFAVAVDDLESGVTDIVRGADLLASCGRQLLVQKLLSPNAPPLRTLHVPLVLDRDGKRLAKRDRSTTIRARRDDGEPAPVLVGMLANSLGIHPTGDPATPEELVSAWNIGSLPRKPTHLSWA